MLWLKWVEVIFVINQESTTISEAFVDQWVSRFGVPIELHSDQGRNFESNIFQEMCKILEINKIRTTLMHPQSDGIVERFNRTLEEYLRKTVKNQKDWERTIQLFLLAYRTWLHNATGYSPCERVFGRNVSIPADIIFGCKNDLS